MVHMEDLNALIKGSDGVDGQSLVIQSLAAAATVTGTGVDCKGFEDGEALVLVPLGAIAAGAALSFTVEESVDNSAWTTFGSSVPIADTDDGKLVRRRIRMRPRKRFLRVKVVQGGAFAAVYGAYILLVGPKATVHQGTDIVEYV